MAHGKRFRMQHQKVQRDRLYPPAEAIGLIKQTASAKFDETVELHVLLGVNVRHADEQLRGTLALPHGLGKDVTIAVFAQGAKARDAEAAGADFVGAQDLAEKIQEGWTDFDVAIATPDMMPVVGQLGRILGPQGKMPNPRSRHRHRRHRESRHRLEVGQSRIPHRPPGDRAHGDRQGELRRRQTARQLPGRDRRDHPRQTVGEQRQIHPLGDPRDHDGPRHPRRHRPKPSTASWSAPPPAPVRLGRVTPTA